jgi:hypothetical protein
MEGEPDNEREQCQLNTPRGLAPMFKLPLLTWIGNAAARLRGQHGDVSAQACQAGCSRQTVYDHAERVQQVLEEAQLPGPSRADLLEQLAQARQDNTCLRQQLAARTEFIEFNKERRKRLAVKTAAMGLSLNQIEDTFDVLLKNQPSCVACKPKPSRATIGRWVLAAYLLAAAVLRVLDKHTCPLARHLCPDEIFFHAKPALVGVEPLSMALLLCRKAKDRTAATWLEALKPFTHLEHAISDAGTGLQAALAELQQQRQAASQDSTAQTPDLTVSLDVFHTEKEAQTQLARQWRGVEAAWAKAEKADKRLQDAKPQRRGCRTVAAQAAWREVQRAWDRYERREAAWKRAKAALALFRPDGQLNDRVWAQTEIEAACQTLPGPRWAKVRALLCDKRTLTWLDRMHQRLQEAEGRKEVREAMVEWWRLEQKKDKASVVQAVVQGQFCRTLVKDWQQSYQRVSEVLSSTVRASSAVECVNSVLRMQQGRHRSLSQGMLDLKRLYWNTRAFRQGKRKGKCPYQLLGASLPTYDFWELLNADPEKLAQQLSSP